MATRKSANNEPMAIPGEAAVPFRVGASYFIRTVTYHLTGRVVRIYPQFLEIEDAAWIADSGRFTQAIRDGKLSEVEPVGKAIVALSAVTDAFPWVHKLPSKQA